MSALVPCEVCSRHVRATETCCPFCDAKRVAREVAPRRTANRVSRAALFAMGAAMAIDGCGGGGGESVSAVYGGPPQEQPAPQETQGQEVEPGHEAPLDDPPSDETDDETESDATDPPPTEATDMDDGAPVTLYGGPPR